MKKTARIIVFTLVIILAAGGILPAGQKVETVEGVRVVHNPAAGKWGKTPQVTLQPVRTIGDVDTEDENFAFNQPSDLAVDAQGRLCVLDSGNHRVQVFSPDGKYIKTIGRQGQGPGEFFMPNSIDLDRNGNLYVSESNAARIQAISPDGKIAKTVKLTEGGVGDTHVLNSGEFLMGGRGGGMRMMRLDLGGPAEKGAVPPLVKIFDPDGKQVREFGKGADFGDFLVNNMANETVTVVDAADAVYLVFPFQNRLEKYSYDGRLLWKADRELPYSMEIKSRGEMKREGQGGGTLNVSVRMPDLTRCATGSAVDGRGRLWVVTMARQLKENEKVRTSMMMSNTGGVVSGSQKTEGAVDLRKTDAYKLEVFDAEGVLLGSIPVSIFVDAIFIEGDRLFLIDRVRGVAIHEFKIEG